MNKCAQPEKQPFRLFLRDGFAGLIPLREFDKRWKLTEEIDNCITDNRQKNLIKHQQLEMLRQRLYQIAAGYEDASDCNLLRNDITMKLAADKQELSEPLASQPTVSRLENRAIEQEVERMNKLNIDWYIKTRHEVPEEIILDIDSTDDETHGGQQLALFNGFYGEYMYHPLLIYEAKSGHLLSARLRKGTAHTAEGAEEMLENVIDRLQKKFPGTKIYVRGDSGFGKPELYGLCEGKKVQYTIGIKGNPVLKRKAHKVFEKAQKEYEETGKPVQLHNSFIYRAGSWVKSRRIRFKAECNSEGTNLRFMVSTKLGRSKDVFKFYNGRGECENRIKELKNGFSADRLSCQEYRANAFRLALHSLSYNLVNLFREKILKNTELASAQIDTLRYKFFKIGAIVKETCRKIWIKIAEGWPYRNLYGQIHAALACNGPPAGYY
ncbi:MAG: IS1380 family transposase [Actinomycetota bacterium]|nr:IS1380 family transposase [Actinomycetota bacterium]